MPVACIIHVHVVDKQVQVCLPSLQPFCESGDLECMPALYTNASLCSALRDLICMSATYALMMGSDLQDQATVPQDHPTVSAVLQSAVSWCYNQL